MKKNGIYVICTLLLIILCVISFSLNMDKGNLKKIDYQKYESLLKESTPSLVYLRSNNCEGCDLQEPILESISAFYNITIHSITYNELSSEEVSKIAYSIDEEATTITTPSLLVLQDELVQETLVGFYEEKDIVSFLKKTHMLEGLILIDIEEYLELIEQEETAIIYVGDDSCEPCNEFKPTIEKVLKEQGVFAYYLNVNNLNDEEKNLYMNSFEELNDGIYAPHILITSNNELLGDLIGIVEESTITGVLRANNLIE